MTYSERARQRRQCLATKANGARCQAWAVWGAEQQRCAAHLHHHTGPMAGQRRHYPTLAIPCTCAAYAWPHRPGGGLCRWPEPPRYRRTTAAGTHGPDRNVRRKFGVAVLHLLGVW